MGEYYYLQGPYAYSFGNKKRDYIADLVAEFKESDREFWKNLYIVRMEDMTQAKDLRGGSLFYETTAGKGKTITDMTDFLEGGYSYKKFTNLKADGSILADANSFPDTDFPIFRLADVYLMLAECQVVGGVSVDGLSYLNQIRQRAGLNPLASATANDIIDERGRELAWECHRRSDLVRFDMLTTDSYIWSYKGMNSNIGTPHAVDKHFNLYPIPSSDIMSNSNLKQNEGY